MTVPRGYFLVRSDPAETARFEAYGRGLDGLLADHGGRTLVRSAKIATPTHAGPSFKLTIVEFPALANVQGLLARPEHAALQRENAPEGLGRSWAMPGVEPPPALALEAREPCAYIVTRTTVKDAVLLERFQPLVASLIATHGGRYLVRTDAGEIVSGRPDAWDPSRFVLLEYQSMVQIRDALASQDMADMRKMWDGIGRIELWVVAGVSGTAG